MPQNFLACDRDQVMLLPPDMQEWLPAGHLARFVIATVEQLDLSAVYGDYRQDGHGRPAHDPAMMVALVLYAYAVGVTSSRQIERRCVEDVAFRVITANRLPDHATVARFLVRHRVALSELFFEVLALCRRAGLVGAGTVAVDSTKVAANASLDQNRSWEALQEEARRVIEEAIATDEREDALFGEARGDELPEELADPRTRAARIRELLEEGRREREEIAQRRAELHAKEAERQATPRGSRRRGPRPGPGPDRNERVRLARKFNLTDPASRIVRHRGMLMQGYAIQTAVADGQIVLSARIVDSPVDQGQLIDAVDDAVANLARVDRSEPIREVLADTGYWNTRQIRELLDRGLTVLVPPRRPDQRPPEAQQMRELLDSPEGQRAYRRRQQIVEPVFAHWKHHRGITRVLRRGKAAVQAEISLIATTHNLLKLFRGPLPA